MLAMLQKAVLNAITWSQSTAFTGYSSTDHQKLIETKRQTNKKKDDKATLSFIVLSMDMWNGQWLNLLEMKLNSVRDLTEEMSASCKRATRTSSTTSTKLSEAH